MLETNIIPDISIVEIENAYIIEDSRMNVSKAITVHKNHKIINELIDFLDNFETNG